MHAQAEVNQDFFLLESLNLEVLQQSLVKAVVWVSHSPAPWSGSLSPRAFW